MAATPQPVINQTTEEPTEKATNTQPTNQPMKLAPLICPKPSQAMAETATIAKESDVIIRIGRVVFTGEDYFSDTVVGL